MSLSWQGFTTVNPGLLMHIFYQGLCQLSYLILIIICFYTHYLLHVKHPFKTVGATCTEENIQSQDAQIATPFICTFFNQKGEQKS